MHCFFFILGGLILSSWLDQPRLEEGKIPLTTSSPAALRAFQKGDSRKAEESLDLAREFREGHIPGAVNISIDSFTFTDETVLNNSLKDIERRLGRKLNLILIDEECADEYMPRAKLEELVTALPADQKVGDLALFLQETEHLDFNDPVFTEVLARTVTPDMPLSQKLEKLFYFTRDAITFAASASLKASEALKKGTAICYNKAMIYVSFCRRLGVPAALATEEFIIIASPKKSLHRHGIAKIYYEGRWHYIDTVSNREAWTYWHKEGAADFRPPAFSLEAHTVVGEDTISGLRFIDAETNDVPKEWLESLSRFQKAGKW